MLDEQMLITASYAIASLVEETHMKEDNVIPKVNDPRICRIVTQTLKEAIGNHIPKPLKDGVSNMLVRRVEYVQVSSQP